jgi:Mg2+/Co2+ transporter CorB
VLSSASQSGAVEVYEQDMIEGVLDLQRSKVDQIMTPRVELVAVAQTASLAELAASVKFVFPSKLQQSVNDFVTLYQHACAMKHTFDEVGFTEF